MKKLALKLSLLALAVCTVLTGASKCLDSFFTAKFRSQKEFWIVNQRNQRYDFGVIGSSRVCNMVDINEMQKTCGGNGINLGVSGTNYAGNYLMLNRFINGNNRIKTLLIEVDTFSLDSRHSFSNPFRVQNYVPFIGVDPDVEAVIADNVEGRKYRLWKYLPFTKYAEFNTEYCNYVAMHLRSRFRTALDESRGFMEPERKRRCFQLANTSKSIDGNDYKYLCGIIDYCRDKGIDVVLFTSPQYFEVKTTMVTYPTYADVLQHIIEMKRLPYFDCDSGAFCRDKRYFLDCTHTNNEGSRKFSRQLGQRLAAHLRKASVAPFRNAPHGGDISYQEPLD